MAATSVDAAVQIALDARLPQVVGGDVPGGVAMFAPTTLDFLGCALLELGDDAPRA